MPFLNKESRQRFYDRRAELDRLTFESLQQIRREKAAKKRAWAAYNRGKGPRPEGSWADGF
jgi:hypothetical protein